jgi:succinate dehydrogenase/fumarate reductase iron-sulfur protein
MERVMTYRVRVARGANGIRSADQTFEVSLQDRMTVLDALFEIQRHQDPGLTFRCACRVGMCGTCATTINGLPRLACRTRPSQLGGREFTVHPLPNLPVIKDVVVSMDPFFEQWKRITPGFRPADPNRAELARIPLNSQYRRETAGKRDCITCGACYGACGVKSTSGEYLGPAGINRAFLRIIDPRDQAAAQRLALIDDERSGVWRCHTQYSCSAVCPKGISLTATIGWLKRAMLRRAPFEKQS